MLTEEWLAISLFFGLWLAIILSATAGDSLGLPPPYDYEEDES